MLAILVLCGWLRVGAAEPKNAPEVPKEVRDLAGAYTGSFTMFGIDEKGDVVKRMAWKDMIKAEIPEIQGDRAFVSTTDEMTFEGSKGPPVTLKGREGFFLKSDGSLGECFIEAAGQTHRMTKMGDNVWSYTAPAAAQELTRLGFPQDASGQHVLVKVITHEQGIETHRISRLSTVSWKDKEGQEKWLQFVSLQGFHKRQP